MRLINQNASVCKVCILVILSFAWPCLGGAKQRVVPIQTIDASSPFTFQQAVPPVPNAIERRYLAVDTGGKATCAIRALDRGIDCWGSNELGNSSPVAKAIKYKSLSLGASIGCALSVGQRLHCWGLDAPLLDNKQASRRYIKVSVGFDHVCAIRADNKAVECWGGTDRLLNLMTPPPGAFITISSGSNATCGVKINKQLTCWGDPAFVNLPRPSGRFTDVAVGNLHACAVRADDASVTCWGNNLYGENNPPMGRFKLVTTGQDHTCGLREDRTVSCWGRNDQGQSNMPIGIRMRSLNAGGTQTCAIDPDSHVVCRGVFKLALPSTTRAILGGFNPIDNGIGMITGYLGGVFTDWANTTGDGSDALLILGGLFGLSADKTAAKLQAIQKKLDQMDKTLQEVNKKSDSIIHDLKDIKCDGKLGALDDATRHITKAFSEYYGTGTLTDTRSYMYLVKDELARAQQPGYIQRDLRIKMREFVKAYYKDLENDLDSINSVLLNQQYLDGPISDCLVKSFADYRASSGDKQIDDRRIWKGVYKILLKAMADQGKAAQMLLDMYKFTAITSLSDPAAQDQVTDGIYSDPVLAEGNGWHADTICADVKIPSPRVNDHRWADARNACKNIEAVTRKVYKNLVQQIEYAGAPYSNNQEILVMGSALMGAGTQPSNFLWHRNPITWPAGVYGLAWGDSGAIPGPWLIHYLNNHGDTYLYWDREGAYENKGTWRSDGQAWWDLFENTKGLPGYNADRLGYMADTLSEFDGAPLINPRVKGTAFWMTGKTWDLDWNWVVVTAPSSDPRPGNVLFRSNGSPTMGGMKCIAAAGLGRVCSDQELGAISLIRERHWGDYWDMSLDFNPQHREYDSTYEYLRNTIGMFSIAYHGYIGENTYYGYDSVINENGMWPWRDAKMNVIPVLDVSQRYCTPSMVIDNSGNETPRQNYRNVTLNDSNPIALPTRCGTDLDYFVEQLLKRPDVPDLDKLVRKPVYPQGVD